MSRRRYERHVQTKCGKQIHGVLLLLLLHKDRVSHVYTGIVLVVAEHFQQLNSLYVQV